MTQKAVLEFVIDNKGAIQSIKKVEKELEGVEKTAKKSGEKSASIFAQAFNGIGAKIAALGIGAALGKFFIDATKEAARFEAGLADLSALTGLVGDDLDYLGQQALSLGNAYGQTGDQVANAMKLVASARPILLENKEALSGVTDAALTLAKAQGISVADSANALGSIMNQFSDQMKGFKSDTEAAANVIDILAAGSKSGAAAVADIAQSMTEFGSVAAVSGLSLETTVASIELLSLAGIKGSKAGTGLKNMMAQLAKEVPTDQLGDLASIMEQYNAKLIDSETGQLDLNKVIKQFGLEAAPAAAVMLKNVDALKKLEEQAGDTGIAQEQLAAKQNTVAYKTEQAQAAWKNFQAELGKTFSDEIKTALDLFTEWITNTLQGIKEIRAGFAGFGEDLAKMEIKSKGGDAWVKQIEKYKLSYRDVLEQIREFEEKGKEFTANDLLAMKQKKEAQEKIVATKKEEVALVEGLTQKNQESLQVQDDLTKFAEDMLKQTKLEHEFRDMLPALQEKLVKALMDGKNVSGETLEVYKQISQEIQKWIDLKPGEIVDNTVFESNVAMVDQMLAKAMQSFGTTTAKVEKDVSGVTQKTIEGIRRTAEEIRYLTDDIAYSFGSLGEVLAGGFGFDTQGVGAGIEALASSAMDSYKDYLKDVKGLSDTEIKATMETWSNFIGGLTTVAEGFFAIMRANDQYGKGSSQAQMQGAVTGVSTGAQVGGVWGAIIGGVAGFAMGGGFTGSDWERVGEDVAVRFQDGFMSAITRTGILQRFSEFGGSLQTGEGYTSGLYQHQQNPFIEAWAEMVSSFAEEVEVLGLSLENLGDFTINTERQAGESMEDALKRVFDEGLEEVARRMLPYREILVQTGESAVEFLRNLARAAQDLSPAMTALGISFQDLVTEDWVEQIKGQIERVMTDVTIGESERMQQLNDMFPGDGVTNMFSGVDFGSTGLGLDSIDIDDAEAFQAAILAWIDALDEATNGRAGEMMNAYVETFLTSDQALRDVLENSIAGMNDTLSGLFDQLGTSRGTFATDFQNAMSQGLDPETMALWLYAAETLSDVMSAGRELSEAMGEVPNLLDLTADQMAELEGNSKDLFEMFRNAGIFIKSLDENFQSFVLGLDIANGGLENFMSQWTWFTENFYSAEEQLAQTTAGLTSALSDVGLSIDDLIDKETYRMWVEQAIAAGNHDLVTSLLAMGPAVLDFLGTVDETGEIAGQASQEFQRLMSAIQSASNGIQSAIQQITRSAASAGGVGGLTDEINRRLGLMGSGSIDGQIENIELLTQLILDRYNMELDDIETVTNASSSYYDQVNAAQQAEAQFLQERYNQELQRYESMQAAAQSIQDFLDSMVNQYQGGELGLNALQSNFDALLQAALGGDADAANQLPQAAQSLLDAAREFYASGAGFQSIFDYVQQSLTDVLGVAQAMQPPEEPEITRDFISGNINYLGNTVVDGVSSAVQEGSDPQQDALSLLDALQDELDRLTTLAEEEEVARQGLEADANRATIDSGKDIHTIKYKMEGWTVLDGDKVPVEMPDPVIASLQDIRIYTKETRKFVDQGNRQREDGTDRLQQRLEAISNNISTTNSLLVQLDNNLIAAQTNNDDRLEPVAV